MSVWDEIALIRADLNTVDQTVSRLTARLRQIEIRQRAIDLGKESETAGPPPLPSSAPPTGSKETPAPEPVAPKPPTVAEIYKPAAPPVPPKPVAETPPVPAPALRKAEPAPEKKRVRRFGPPEGMTFEEALGAYWIPRIGVPLIAMSVVFLFTYVANQYREAAWMPYARIGAGFALAGALLGIGWKLEKKYANYARLVMGGGFGVLYFVLFATWYIPQTRVSPSQEFTLMLLALLVTGWGAIAQWRQSRTVALFMTFMGHFTVALSTLTLEAPSRTAIGGLLLLGAGSAWFLYKNGWYLVGLTAVAGSYLNQFFWLARSTGTGTVPEFVMGMAVLCAYVLLFAAAERITPVNLAGPRQRIRNVYCGLNTGGFLLLALALLRGYDFARPLDYVLYFATAIFAAIMGATYSGRHHTAFAESEAAGPVADPLSGIYFTKASALVTVGFAAWLDGPTLTLTLVLQALVLLIAARESGRPVGRLLSLGTALVAFIHGVYTWRTLAFPDIGEPGFLGVALVLLVTAVLFGALSELYRVTPWHLRAVRPFRGPSVFADLARDLELSGLPEGATPRTTRITLSHILAGFGVLLFLGYAEQLLPNYLSAPLASVFAVAVLAMGMWRGAVPLLTSAVFLSGTGSVWWLYHLYGAEDLGAHPLLLGGLIVLTLLFSAEALRVWVPSRLQAFAQFSDIQGSWCRNAMLMANLYSAVAAVLTLTTVQTTLDPDMGLLFLGATAVTATIYAAAIGSASNGMYSLLICLACAVPAVMLPNQPGQLGVSFLGLLLLGFSATAVEKRYWGEQVGRFVHQTLPAPYLLYGAFAWCGLWFLYAHAPEAYRTAYTGGFGAILALATFVLHARALATMSATIITASSLLWLLAEHQSPPEGPWRVCAGVILVAALAAERLLARRRPFEVRYVDWTLVTLAWVVCIAYNQAVATLEWRFAGIAGIALFYLGYAFVFRAGAAAVLSLAGAAIATVPLVLKPVAVVTASPYYVATGQLAAYAALVLYWLIAERGTVLYLSRTRYKLAESQRPTAEFILTALPALLGVLCIARMEPIHDFYLTLSWTVWALAVFGWAIATRQAWFRYMGLGILGLALGRAFLVDVWKLDGLYRAGAMLVLGSALLAVGYGYTRWRASQIAGEASPGEESDHQPPQ